VHTSALLNVQKTGTGHEDVTVLWNQGVQTDGEVLANRTDTVGIALGFGLDDRGSRVRFPAGAWYFSLHHRIQNGSGAHPTSYPMGTRGSFLGVKAAGA
jgi:hypothetical protein